MDRLSPRLGFAFALFLASVGPSLAASPADTSLRPGLQAERNAEVLLAECPKICVNYGTCWRNWHLVRCCKRWSCRN
jgi:hypothetical protein